jgi:hypothetical protein
MGHTYSVFRVFTVSTILGTEVSRVDNFGTHLLNASSKVSLSTVKITRNRPGVSDL